MDDLSLALGEHGVNVKKPDYCESSCSCLLAYLEANFRSLIMTVPRPTYLPSLPLQRPCAITPACMYHMHGYMYN